LLTLSKYAIMAGSYVTKFKIQLFCFDIWHEFDITKGWLQTLGISQNLSTARGSSTLESLAKGLLAAAQGQKRDENSLGHGLSCLVLGASHGSIQTLVMVGASKYTVYTKLLPWLEHQRRWEGGNFVVWRLFCVSHKLKSSPQRKYALEKCLQNIGS